MARTRKQRKIASPEKTARFKKYISGIPSPRDVNKLVSNASPKPKPKSKSRAQPKTKPLSANRQIKRLVRSSKRILNKSNENLAAAPRVRGQGIKKRLEFVKKKTVEDKNTAEELVTTVAKQTAEEIKKAEAKKAAEVNQNTEVKEDKLSSQKTEAKKKGGRKAANPPQKKTPKASKRKRMVPKHPDRTVEEGEIVSEVEETIECSTVIEKTVITPAKPADENDCILIEPHVSCIVIEDDDLSVNGKEGQSKENVPTKSPTTLLPPLLTPINFRGALAKKRTGVLPCTSTPLERPKTNTNININDESFLDCFLEDFGMNGTGRLYTRRDVNAENKKEEPEKINKPSGSSVILIEDSSMDESAVNSEKDTVIFVSESKPKELPDFIPLGSKELKPKASVSNKTSPKGSPSRKRQRNEFFTNSEQKQLAKYNDNTYNPNKEIPGDNKSHKRFVIVDGSNVAFAHARSREFSVRGIQICIDYFKQQGHSVKVVVPLFRSQPNKSSDPDLLKKLYDQGYVTWTPCKNLPSMRSTSYDDRFILQLACELDAAIISNDNYRDLINENSAFKKVIENRVIGYTWCDDVFLVPKDPYGRNGPTLQHILTS